jgi:hypothetical protein
VAIDIADFKTRYPEFDPVADPVIQLALDDSEMDVVVAKVGDYYERVVFALAAHRLALQPGVAAVGGPSGGGLLASKSVGDVSASYVTPSDLTTSTYQLNSTIYGRTYLELLARGMGSGTMATGNYSG